MRPANYRADIDGLRAFAVGSVVLFHAFPACLPGGFVGVDVFFVISGYLITSLILKESTSGRFSVSDFYARRILRIFPALVLVLGAVYAYGRISLLAMEFQELGRHVAAGGWFMANLFYWKEAGYFDTSAHAKPLLHLWSLGVEEQFYILWPLVVVLTSRWTKRWFAVVGVCLVASLIWSEYQTTTNAVAAYYSPLSRFWELALGGGLAWHERHRGVSGTPSAQWWNEVQAFMGLGLLLLSCMLLNESIPFPGKSAVPAVLGAAMVIGAGPEAAVNKHLLSARAMVWLGLLSYGLYLWHWPVLSYLEIGFGHVPPWYWRLGAVALSVAMAWASLVMVENKLRFGPRRRGIVVLLTSMVIVTGLGYNAFKRNGLPRRPVNDLNPAAQTMTIGRGYELVDMSCPVAPVQARVLTVCWSDRRERPVYAVWGDSKADSLFWGLMRTSTPGHRWLSIGRGVPIIGDDAPYEPFQQISRSALDVLLHAPEVRAVVLTTAMRVLFGLPAGSDEHIEGLDASPYGVAAFEGLSRTIQALQKAGKRVIFVVDNPTLPEPRKCLPNGRAVAVPLVNGGMRWPVNQGCQIARSDHLKQTARYREMVAALQHAHPLLQIYDPTAILCRNGVCASTDGGRFLYWKSDHISDVANELIGKELNAMLLKTP